MDEAVSMRLQTITRMSGSGLKRRINPLAQWQKDGLRRETATVVSHSTLSSLISEISSTIEVCHFSDFTLSEPLVLAVKELYH